MLKKGCALLLRVVAAECDIEVLKVLIALKIDLNEPGEKTGKTSLHIAVEKISNQLLIYY